MIDLKIWNVQGIHPVTSAISPFLSSFTEFPSVGVIRMLLENTELVALLHWNKHIDNAELKSSSNCDPVWSGVKSPAINWPISIQSVFARDGVVYSR